MNKTAIAIALIAIVVSAPAFGADAGDPVSLGQPGFYGRLELGDDAPRPEVYFSEPRLVEHVAEYGDSIFLRVRPGEAREWALHCHQYEACGRFVYFVNDDWYAAVYVPYYRDRGNPERPDGNFGHPDSADVPA